MCTNHISGTAEASGQICTQVGYSN